MTLSETVQLRLSQKDREIILAAAKKSKMTLSEYIRSCCLKGKIITKTITYTYEDS